MKLVIILSILFFLIALPVLGELTDADFDKIRLIVKEEVKTEIAASEKRTKEYIDLKIDALDKNLNARIDAVDKSLNARIDAVDKSLNARIDGLDKRMDNMWRLMLGLFGLVAATIAIPQIIIAYRDRNRKEMQIEIQRLNERISALENTPSMNQ